VWILLGDWLLVEEWCKGLGMTRGAMRLKSKVSLIRYARFRAMVKDVERCSVRRAVKGGRVAEE